jgi:glutamate N-acetyltransferase/amino-acid N-acetyltransferase
MAVALTEPVSIDPVAGIRLASVAASIKKNGNNDMVVLVFEETANCAAVFTRNAFCAAPVTLARKHLSNAHSGGRAVRALLINSGNANAGTGETGMLNAKQSCQWLADELGCSAEQILPFSTGVIGEQLPMEKMQNGIKQLVTQLSEDNWMPAARGIMTTDTVLKAVSRKFRLGEQDVVLSGMAKGSGMICPDMATMLSFIATDADVDADFLQQCLNEVIEDSFNAITVDGDTSTNDSCVLVATGAANNRQLDVSSADAEIFINELKHVCQQLAQAIIRDAEGATKFVTVAVSQSQSRQEARNVAYTIAHSPLVKTALFASDPNWGRILAAVGRADINDLDIAGVNIFLDDICIVSGGGVDNDYTEEQGQRVMNQQEITIRVELGRGKDSAVLWTSDLSHEYVRINSEYRS